MNHMVINVLMTMLALALSGNLLAATPFGGDVKGFLPTPKTPIAKCQGKTTKNVGKLVKCLAKCHVARVTGKLPDATAQEACESNNAGKSCREKFTASQARLTGCPVCLGTSEFIGGRMERLVDHGNALAYCGDGVPFGGEDTGDLPSDAPKGPTAKCANKIEVSVVAKAFEGMGKCHAKRADGILADPNEESQCEFDAFYLKTGSVFDGCDSCIYESGHRDAVADYIRASSDDLNGAIYCEAPTPCGFAGDACGPATSCCNGLTCESDACCVPVGESQCLTDGDCCEGTCESGTCQVFCGNGLVDAGEVCEYGTCGDGERCSSDCTECVNVCHDVCTTGVAMVASCGSCVADVCAADPYCCGTSWDEVCVDEASEICGACP